jgi:hypothetical protein
MVKWEYSKMIEPTRLPGKHAEPAKLVYLGVSKEEERVENIETVGHAGSPGARRLGAGEPHPGLYGRRAEPGGAGPRGILSEAAGDIAARAGWATAGSQALDEE